MDCTVPGMTVEPDSETRTRRLVFEVAATGFLRHMVRVMLGTLVEIGAGRREAASIEQAFTSGNRADAGPTAPASGLCLVRVDYRSGE